jgi:hypothetical protein
MTRGKRPDRQDQITDTRRALPTCQPPHTAALVAGASKRHIFVDTMTTDAG